MLDTAYDDDAVFLGDDFATNVLIGGVALRGVFDNAFERGGVGVGMASFQPALRIPAAKVPSLTDDMPVVVGGVLTVVGGVTTLVGGTSYKYREQEPDGTGWTVLFLERAR